MDVVLPTSSDARSLNVHQKRRWLDVVFPTSADARSANTTLIKPNPPATVTYDENVGIFLRLRMSEFSSDYTYREIFFEFCSNINLIPIVIPIYLAPNGIQIGVESIGKIQLQFEFSSDLYGAIIPITRRECSVSRNQEGPIH